MEKELFDPIKKFFEAQGYVCDGEVQDIDLYMEKGDESVAVELKVTLDFKAVQQAALRQKVADTVFIGIFLPKNLRSRSFRDKVYLLNRLGIGLLTYSKGSGRVEIIAEPVVHELSSYRRRNAKKKISLSGEFQKRTLKSNTGGVHRTKLITSYREKALLVLDALCELGGTASTKQIKQESGVADTTAILYKNYYGWFENTGRGTYRLLDDGYAALEEFETELRALKKRTP